MEYIVLIGSGTALLGTVLIFDARSLSKKLFGFGDQNEATSGLKIVGFILAMVGAFMVYYHP